MNDIPLQDLKRKSRTYNAHSGEPSQHLKGESTLDPSVQEPHRVPASQGEPNSRLSHLDQCDYCRHAALSEQNAESGDSGVSTQTQGTQDLLSLGEKFKHRQRVLSNERLGRWLRSPEDREHITTAAKNALPEPEELRSIHHRNARFSVTEDPKIDRANRQSADLEDIEDVSSSDYTEFADWIRDRQLSSGGHNAKRG